MQNQTMSFIVIVGANFLFSIPFHWSSRNHRKHSISWAGSCQMDQDIRTLRYAVSWLELRYPGEHCTVVLCLSDPFLYYNEISNWNSGVTTDCISQVWQVSGDSHQLRLENVDDEEDSCLPNISTFPPSPAVSASLTSFRLLTSSVSPVWSPESSSASSSLPKCTSSKNNFEEFTF